MVRILTEAKHLPNLDILLFPIKSDEHAHLIILSNCHGEKKVDRWEKGRGKHEISPIEYLLIIFVLGFEVGLIEKDLKKPRLKGIHAVILSHHCDGEATVIELVESWKEAVALLDVAFAFGEERLRQIIRRKHIHSTIIRMIRQEVAL